MDYLVIRCLCSLISGIIISQTGSLIQLGTRNILASPSTLGFDGLSILWILLINSVAVFFAWENNLLELSLLGIPLFISLGLLFSQMVRAQKKFEKIILLGLTFNLFVGAIFSSWQFLFLAFNLPFPTEVWFGHFRFAQLNHGLLLLGMEILLLTGLFSFRKSILLFSLGPTHSKNLGLNEKQLFRLFFILVSLGTFMVVSLFGAFSFLGLVFPIVARSLWFKKFDLEGEFLWGSLLNGAVFMVIDLACYEFPIYGSEIPVGLPLTVVGAVSLIGLLWKSNGFGELLANIRK